MTIFNEFVGMLVNIETTGGGNFTGFLIDAGSDIVVIYNEKKYFYIPTAHVKQFKLQPKNESYGYTPPDPGEIEKQISFLDTLRNAKGAFVEIYVSDKQTLHGYVTNILKDYFVFYSPLYKTMYIPLFHVKWISPYLNQSPYSLDQEPFSPPASPDPALPDTFAELLKTLEGKIVCFDSGFDSNKIGLLRRIKDNYIELVTADEKKRYHNIHHIKNCIYPVK